MTQNSRALWAVLTAQFCSALADNALLFAAIALLKSTQAPAWHTPVLQEFFLLAYILLAPFVGHLADAWPKGRVMLVANLCKLMGAGTMLVGLDPLLAYGLVGVGAAAYSPAKYGILNELVSAERLVTANGMLEGATIGAILLGVVLGGALADQGALLAVGVTVAIYALATLINLWIPQQSTAVGARSRLGMAAQLKAFWSALLQLSADPSARTSLLGTSIFWGAGSTLRMLLMAWVPAALGIFETQTPANLSGAVALGIAAGAAAAARYVTLEQVGRVLPMGVVLGLLIVGFSQVTDLWPTVVLLVGIGACGGCYVVPLNALLQKAGHESVGAGQAIAVQNFLENSVMLVMVGLYALMSWAGVSPMAAAALFGSTISLGVGVLAMSYGRPREKAA